MKLKQTSIIAVSIISASFLISACSKEEAAELAVKDTTTETNVSGSIFLDAPPPSAITVSQAREEARPGMPIVVTGQIGGTLNPIAKEYASFIIADQSIQFCDEMAGHGCQTPWDACCEDPDKLAANRASVVFLDDTGRPKKLSLKGQRGLTELDQVTVSGIVAPSSTAQNLIINASGLYVAVPK